MGRRAKKAPVQTKRRITLAKRFKCPFCANENSVECTMNLRLGTGSLACRICDASFQMPIHHLHEPIDVFSEWLDACEAAERNGGEVVHEDQNVTQGGESTLQAGFEYEDSDDDDLGEASGLGAKKGDSKAGAEAQKQSYSALGLGDSDDDSD